MHPFFSFFCLETSFLYILEARHPNGSEEEKNIRNFIKEFCNVFEWISFLHCSVREERKYVGKWCNFCFEGLAMGDVLKWTAVFCRKGELAAICVEKWEAIMLVKSCMTKKYYPDVCERNRNLCFQKVSPMECYWNDSAFTPDFPTQFTSNTRDKT